MLLNNFAGMDYRLILRKVVKISSTLCSLLFAFSALQKSLNIIIFADFAP